MLMFISIAQYNFRPFLFFVNDHIDNKRLPKKIKPLPLHSRVVYLKKDFTLSHKYFQTDLFNCPSSGVIKDKLTMIQDCAHLDSQFGESENT